PNSSIRFLRSDGVWTSWWRARDLLVSDDGLLIETQGGGHEGVRWSDVEEAEIENFSGGKSLVATVAVSAAVIGIIAVVSASKGKIGNLGNVGGLFVRTTANVAVRTTAAIGRSGHFHLGSGSSGSSGSSGASSSAPSSEPPVPEICEPPAANGAQPLFDGVTRRRSIARFGAALDAGSAFREGHAFTSSAIGTVRFVDYFEIGAGLRFVSRGSGADRLIVGRLGMHAELDAYRRFAIPLLLDIGGGGGAAKTTVRIAVGLRVRITDALWAGIFPPSPQYVGYAKGTPDVASGWTFPSTVETSFLF
ncbi:MAG: hypothetical protein ACXWUG_24545, partial [Polyangiales bacterium]